MKPRKPPNYPVAARPSRARAAGEVHAAKDTKLLAGGGKHELQAGATPKSPLPSRDHADPTFPVSSSQIKVQMHSSPVSDSTSEHRSIPNIGLPAEYSRILYLCIHLLIFISSQRQPDKATAWLHRWEISCDSSRSALTNFLPIHRFQTPPEQVRMATARAHLPQRRDQIYRHS